MRRTLYFFISAALGYVTANAQGLDAGQEGFTFTRKDHMLTAISPDGRQQVIDLNSPAFRGKALAFTYSAKKKKAYQEPEKALCSARVFPNPVTGVVNLALEGQWDFPVRAQFFDQTGNLVKVSTLEVAEVSLNVSTLARGIYILRLETGKATSIKKISVQ